MIIIHVSLQVNPDHRDDFLALSQTIVAGSQAEEGNIRYQLFEEVGRPNSFVIVEVWQDQAALDFHNQTPHFLEFGKQSKEKPLYTAPPQVEIYTATPKQP